MKYVIDRFRSWNLLRINRRRLMKPPKKTPLGFLMKGPSYLFHDNWEVEEIKFFRQLLSKSHRFINVGANVGVYVLLARQSGLAVTAFEPVPQTVQFLLQNLEINSLTDQVTVIPAAVSDATGVETIYGVGTGASLLKDWGNNPKSLAQRVPVVCLDDVIKMPNKNEQLLILVDVEGLEYKALLGAKKLIAAWPRPIWIVETISEGTESAQKGSANEVFSLFAKAGYSAKCIDPCMTPTDGPVRGVTNYVFFGEEQSLDKII